MCTKPRLRKLWSHKFVHDHVLTFTNTGDTFAQNCRMTTSATNHSQDLWPFTWELRALHHYWIYCTPSNNPHNAKRIDLWAWIDGPWPLRAQKSKYRQWLSDCCADLCNVHVAFLFSLVTYPIMFIRPCAYLVVNSWQVCFGWRMSSEDHNTLTWCVFFPPIYL